MSASFLGFTLFGLETESRIRNLRLVTTTGALAALVLAAINFVLGLTDGRWQFFSIAAVMGIWSIFLLTGFILLSQKSLRISAWLMIASTNITLLSVPFFLSGLGIILGVSLVIFIILSSLQTMEAKDSIRATISGLVFGFSTILVEILMKYLMAVQIRIPAPSWLQAILVILTAVLTIIWGTSLVYEYPHSRMRDRLRSGLILLSLAPTWGITLAALIITFNSLSIPYRILGIALLIGFSFLTTAFSVMLANILTNPIKKMASIASQVQAGDYYAVAGISRSDELGTISNVYDQLTTKLRDVVFELEQRIAERSSLERTTEKSLFQAEQLKAVSDVARAAMSAQSLDRLLPDITLRISEDFGFYHTGIFLLDESGKYAVLRATNSEGGKRMLTRGHKLEVGQVGIVGHVASTGQPRVARDVGEDAVYFENPDLPETRSEIALPLKSSDKTIGVLDIQTEKPDAFSKENIEILTTLADQVSIAIENTRLLESTRRSLIDVETLYRQFIQREWSRLTREEKLAGFKYALSGVIPLEKAIDSPEIQKSISEGKIYKQIPEGDDGTALLAVPIQLRGETIGFFNVSTQGNQPWTTDQVDLVKAVADRLALSVENARLFEETSRRADRERAVSEITTKIRSTTDPQLMLQTAIEELRQVLGAKEILIRPYSPSEGGGKYPSSQKVVSLPDEEKNKEKLP